MNLLKTFNKLCVSDVFHKNNEHFLKNLPTYFRPFPTFAEMPWNKGFRRFEAKFPAQSDLQSDCIEYKHL